jgi:hypothetical protein
VVVLASFDTSSCLRARASFDTSSCFGASSWIAVRTSYDMSLATRRERGESSEEKLRVT